MSALRQDQLDDRSEPRWPMRLGVSVRSANLAKRSATLIELSQRGCRLEMDAPDREGDLLLIHIAGLQALPATLVWNSGGQCGLALQHPLHIAVVDHLVRTNPVAG